MNLNNQPKSFLVFSALSAFCFLVLFSIQLRANISVKPDQQVILNYNEVALPEEAIGIQGGEALDGTIGDLGTISENNTADNRDYGYHLSKAVSQTVFNNPVYVDVREITNKSEFPESGEIRTAISNFEREKIVDPFSEYLTGEAPSIVEDLGEETENGVKLRKIIFQSYNYTEENKEKSATIFAVIARPEKDGKYPGLLVLHGGGGFAEIEKAKKWAALGYVVVALDEPGVASPEKIPFSHGPWNKYKYGENRFVVKPDIKSSTLFSAVLASVQGLYLLHSQPDVIKDKVGIVGISWGGYLTTIVSGLANQFINASFSVYGSGFYDDGSVFLEQLDIMEPSDRALWLKYLDAGRRASSVKTPFFIAAAANDQWFYPPAVTSTLKNIKGQVNHLFAPNCSHKIELPGGTVSLKPDQPGWLAMEQIYFDYYMKGIGHPLPQIQKIKTEQSASGNTLVKFKVNSSTEIINAQVSYSLTGVKWPERKWETVSAKDSGHGWYVAEIPSGNLKQPFECFATVSDSRPVSVSGFLIWCN